jgi:ectoine hydroxylase-related dioxygenase (phytanoyl-CoA dioxygenase family)
MCATRDIRMSDSNLTEEQRRTLDDNGYLVLPNVLSKEECDVWSRALDDAWEKDRISPSPHQYREEPGVQFIPNLLRHSLLFEKCIIEPRVLEGVRAALGSSIVLHLVNARRVDPGCGQQPLHDLDRKRGRPFNGCNTLWCLDEFTETNGSTRVIPGSHLTDSQFLARMKDPWSLHPDERSVVAPRGAVVIFNAHLIHGGSTNQSAKPRRSVHSYFTPPDRPPHYNWHELPHDIRAGLKAESRRMLGLAASND